MPVHRFTRPKGRILEVTIESDALAGNLLGDPTTRAVGVYLPEGYESSDDDYPLFVDVVGFMGSGLSHLSEFLPFGESVPQRLDRLLAEGKMGPVIAAFPDCFTSLGGNQYINSVAMGNWEDFLIDEMIPALERRFRVRPGRRHRALFGKSSGGYGAIVHGLRRADAWGAVACHSGDMAFELAYGPEVGPALRAIAAHGGDVSGYLEHLASLPKMKKDDTDALMMIAMAATYAPDPEAPKGARLPFDLETGERDEAAWARWMDHDPVELAARPECQDNLRSLAGVYIDCGVKDQFNLVYGARLLHRMLDEAGVPHRYEEFDDDHSGIDYRMDVSLPFLYEAVTRPD